MSEVVNSYKVLLTKENGIWLIEARGLPGVRSFGRTVTDAASNIREAIAAAEDLEEWSELELVYTLDDPAATVALQEFRQADNAEAQASAERERALGAVVRSLRSQGMSYRDIGTVIGFSHQRVAQLDAQTRVERGFSPG
jgi:predicted RNase H-like HicB family nuclease